MMKELLSPVKTSEFWQAFLCSLGYGTMTIFIIYYLMTHERAPLSPPGSFISNLYSLLIPPLAIVIVAISMAFGLAVSLKLFRFPTIIYIFFLAILTTFVVGSLEYLFLSNFDFFWNLLFAKLPESSRAFNLFWWTFIYLSLASAGVSVSSAIIVTFGIRLNPYFFFILIAATLSVGAFLLFGMFLRLLSDAYIWSFLTAACLWIISFINTLIVMRLDEAFKQSNK